MLTGGALARRGVRIDRLGSQTDLAATLLGMLGVAHGQFRYSRDMFSPRAAQVAIFTEPSLVGIVTPSDTLLYNPEADAPADALPAKAFLRDLYSTLGAL